MKTDRIKAELGWTPRYSSIEALQSVLEGLAAGQGVAGAPPLLPLCARQMTQTPRQ